MKQGVKICPVCKKALTWISKAECAGATGNYALCKRCGKEWYTEFDGSIERAHSERGAKHES